MRYRLRTLMIVLALGPPMLAGLIWLGWQHYWVALVEFGVMPG